MTTMTRKEALQSLKTARLSVEAAIRQAKTITRAARRPAGTVAPSQDAFSAAQSQLLGLKLEATRIYSTIAAIRGKTHCPKSTKLLEEVQASIAKGRATKESSKIIAEALKSIAPKELANASAAA
jgi:type II secretory pathway component PulF